MRITTYRTELNEDKHNILVKESSHNYTAIENLSSPQKITDMMNSVFRLNKLPEEHLYMLALNTKNKVLGVFEISHGIVNASFCNPREIFIRALLCGASNIVLVHNHPSGDNTPSKEDIHTSKRIAECGKLMGIGLIDSIIVGDDYYSFKEKGMI